MKRRTKGHRIVGRITLSTDDDSLDPARSIVAFWQVLPASLRAREYNHSGCRVLVRVDWTPVHALFKKQLEVSELFRTGRNDVPIESWRIYFKEISLPAYIDLVGQNEWSGYDWYPGFFLEAYLYDLFLVLNLAFPGAADFSGLYIRAAKSDQSDRVELSAFCFENAFRSRENWPALQEIDPVVVLKWFSRVRDGFAQVPSTPVERALFALFHICRSDGRPEDIVWLFYAFESLFQTRAGENLTALHERLGLLLQPDATQEKALRKKLRAMYDIRSAFVHGGLEVIHPMHNEVMDRRVEKAYGSVLELTLYGFKLLLACLQRYIREDWHEVRYRTILSPKDDADRSE